MTASTAERDTRFRPSNGSTFVTIPVLAGEKIFYGCMVTKTGAGFAKNGVKATSVTIEGVADETVDNTSGANGDKNVRVKRGIFFINTVGGGNGIGVDDVGKTFYLEDNVTGTLDSTGASKAGKVDAIETGGFWAEIDPKVAI